MRALLRGSAVVIVAALLARFASAGDWQPDPGRRFSLEVGEGRARSLAEADREWAHSLVANLVRRGGTVEAFDVLPLHEQSRLLVDGAPAAYRVYEVEPGARYLGVSPEGLNFLVDLARKTVVVAAGPSLHPHPSGRFLVAVHSHGHGFGGIPVAGPGVELRFDERLVSWQ